MSISQVACSRSTHFTNPWSRLCRLAVKLFFHNSGRISPPIGYRFHFLAAPAATRAGSKYQSSSSRPVSRVAQQNESSWYPNGRAELSACQ